MENDQGDKSTTPKASIGEELKGPKSKFDKESAEREFERFVDLMDLDIEEDTLDDEDKKGLRDNKRIFLRAIMQGSLVVNDSGEPIFTPQRKGSTSHHSITFHEPCGSALQEMDRKKAGQDIGKMIVVMGNVTKTAAPKFAGLKHPDFKVCMAIMMLYMG